MSDAEDPAVVAAALGGAGGMGGAAIAAIPNVEPRIGFLLAAAAGLTISGAGFLVYDQLVR